MNGKETLLSAKLKEALGNADQALPGNSGRESPPTPTKAGTPTRVGEAGEKKPKIHEKSLKLKQFIQNRNLRQTKNKLESEQVELQRLQQKISEKKTEKETVHRLLGKAEAEKNEGVSKQLRESLGKINKELTPIYAELQKFKKKST